MANLALELFSLLLSPTIIAFVWEPIIIGLWIMGRMLKPMGKIELKRFRIVNGLRIALKSSWVPVGSRQARVRKGEAHIIEQDDYAYLQPDSVGSHPVMFFDADKMRAIHPEWIDEQVKLTRRVHNPKGKGEDYQINPDSEDADMHLYSGTLKDLVIQSLNSKPGLLLLIMVGIAAIGGGYILAGVVNPPHVIFACPPGDSCTSVPVTSGTATVTA